MITLFSSPYITEGLHGLSLLAVFYCISTYFSTSGSSSIFTLPSSVLDRDHARSQEHECDFLSHHSFLHTSSVYVDCEHRDVLSSVAPVYHSYYYSVVLPALTCYLLLRGPDTDVMMTMSSTSLSVVYILLHGIFEKTSLDHLRHFLLVCLTHPSVLQSTWYEVCIITLYGILCFFQTEYVLLLPVFLYLVSRPQSSRSAETEKYSLKASVGFHVIVVVGLLAMLSYAYGEWLSTTVLDLIPSSFTTSTLVTLLKQQYSILAHKHVDLTKQHYQVSYGIMWYLHALTLPSFTSFFQALLCGLPMIASVTLLSLFKFQSNSKQLTVRDLTIDIHSSIHWYTLFFCQIDITKFTDSTNVIVANGYE